jgi:hypothetical protein
MQQFEAREDSRGAQPGPGVLEHPYGPAGR